MSLLMLLMLRFLGILTNGRPHSPVDRSLLSRVFERATQGTKLNMASCSWYFAVDGGWVLTPEGAEKLQNMIAPSADGKTFVPGLALATPEFEPNMVASALLDTECFGVGFDASAQSCQDCPARSICGLGRLEIALLMSADALDKEDEQIRKRREEERERQRREAAERAERLRLAEERAAQFRASQQATNMAAPDIRDILTRLNNNTRTDT